MSLGAFWSWDMDVIHILCLRRLSAVEAIIHYVFTLSPVVLLSVQMSVPTSTFLFRFVRIMNIIR